MVVMGNNYDVVMCFRLVASSFVYCLWKVSESPTYLYLSITSRPSYVVICFLPASLPVAYVCEMSKSHESVSVHLYLLFQCGNIFFSAYFLLFTVCGKSKSSVPVYLFLSLSVVICFFLLTSSSCLLFLESRFPPFLYLVISSCPSNVVMCFCYSSSSC